uniref:Uncharacterized protein n=1 Tax=Arundo donax TaxID=35708 RepID=A0A0A8ZH43_ARUDO
MVSQLRHEGWGHSSFDITGEQEMGAVVVHVAGKTDEHAWRGTSLDSLRN